MQFLKDITNLFMWLSFSLLGFLAPRDKKSIVILAPVNSAFADNVKYAYLWLDEEKDLSAKYVVYDKSIRDELLEKGIQAVFYPSWEAVLLLLRASVVIGSATVPFQRIRGHLTSGAKLVQLWHGAGIKKLLLGADKYSKHNWTFRNRFEWLINRKIPVFDLLYFPSEKMKEVRKDWFRFKDVKINGFVRNDILLGKSFGSREEIDTDAKTSKKIQALKGKGYKIILYAPTYRKQNETIFNKEVPFDFFTINELMKNKNSYFVIKLHPWINEQIELKKYDRILEYEKNKDIYPNLKFFDILITDYSSIFSDYALLKKPIIHYIPDFDQVLSKKDISEDMITELPGPVFFTFDDLEDYLKLMLKGMVVFEPLEENIFHDNSKKFSGTQLIEDVRRLAKI